MPATTSTTRPNRVWQLLGSALLGLVVGAVGTGVHRANPPWGLVLAGMTVVSAAVLARAWGKGRALAVFGLGLAAMVLAMAYWRPGDDVLVADEGIGYAWVAALVLVLAVAVLPVRLFSDRPLVRRREPEPPS